MIFTRSIFVCLLSIAIFASCEKEYSCEGCYAAPGDNDEGKVIFYSLNSCVNNRPIQLTVDGNRFYLVEAFFSPPDCTTPGVTAVMLTGGTHTWQAYCELVGIVGSGTIEVFDSGCTLQQIN